jgi:hypothetical protein
MKLLTLDTIRTVLAPCVVGLTALLATGCALNSKEEWAQARSKGLIPALIDARQAEVAAVSTRPSGQEAVRVQAVATPAVVRTLYAEPVPGQPGYVYSPHTNPRRVVDVRGYQMGEEVRCPYTTRSFLVPVFGLAASASRPEPVRPDRSVAEVVSSTPTETLIDQSLTRLEPPPSEPTPPVPVEPVNPDAGAANKPVIPYGTRVAGRPGFVYSPHAAKTQLVDVAGTAPGVVVRCPYTNKLFRVPEVNSEEISPAPAAPAPPVVPTETPEAPAPSPEKTTPPSEPAPVPPAAPGPLSGIPR